MKVAYVNITTEALEDLLMLSSARIRLTDITPASNGLYRLGVSGDGLPDDCSEDSCPRVRLRYERDETDLTRVRVAAFLAEEFGA